MSGIDACRDRDSEVRRVAAAIAAGTYSVDVHDVAEAVLRRWASEEVGSGAIADWVAYSSGDGTASASRD